MELLFSHSHLIQFLVSTLNIRRSRIWGEWEWFRLQMLLLLLLMMMIRLCGRGSTHMIAGSSSRSPVESRSSWGTVEQTDRSGYVHWRLFVAIGRRRPLRHGCGCRCCCLGLVIQRRFMLKMKMLLLLLLLLVVVVR